MCWRRFSRKGRHCVIFKQFNNGRVFTNEKYITKEKNIHNFNIDDVEIFSDSEEEDLLEKIQLEKILIMTKILMNKTKKRKKQRKRAN